MKKYLFSVLFSFTFVPLSAQTYNMKIVKKSGDIVQILADDIERISFEESVSPQPSPQYVTLFGRVFKIQKKSRTIFDQINAITH